MATSLLIMVGLTGYKDWMGGLLPVNIWYIISTLLAPVGFILQDVVADAMTVEAVPAFRTDGTPLPDEELKRMHVTVQTLGRVAILGGSAAVAGLGGWLAQTLSYAAMYWISLIIPAISVTGVVLGGWMQHSRRKKLKKKGFSETEIAKMTRIEDHTLTPNYFILGGSGIFVAMTLAIGLSKLSLKEET
jgi:MFS family permease